MFRSASVSGPSGPLELNVRPPRTRAWSMFGKVAGQLWALGRFVLQPHEWQQRVRESGLPAGGCWFYWRHWARPAALRAPSASRLLLGLSCLAQGKIFDLTAYLMENKFGSILLCQVEMVPLRQSRWPHGKFRAGAVWCLPAFSIPGGPCQFVKFCLSLCKQQERKIDHWIDINCHCCCCWEPG